MSKGLEALERLMNDYYEMCENTLNNDDNYQKYNLTSERAVIEKELKAFRHDIRGHLLAIKHMSDEKKVEEKKTENEKEQN